MPSATAEWYARAATRDLVGHSALHVAWAAGVAADEEVLELLELLPRERRQPSLVFSVARFLGAPAGGYREFRSWLLGNWDDVDAEARRRRTQTNEPGRCAPLVAALDRIRGPLALLEIGAAAGLCLQPDRYSYRFGDGLPLGTGTPLLECRVSGEGHLPRSLPDIVWRRGLDLDPLSVLDPGDVRWLEALLPPDRPDRLARLRAAVATARADPPDVIAGHAANDLGRAAADAPANATLVVVSLGTLVYLSPDERLVAASTVRALGARLVTLEGTVVLPDVAARLEAMSAPEPTPFVLALDGHPLAHVSPHGDRLSWLSAAGRPEDREDAT